MILAPDLSNAWDVLRIVSGVMAIIVVVGGAALLVRPMPGIPRSVEGSRTMLIVGTLGVVTSTTAGRIRNFGEPPTPSLFISAVALLFLLVWLVREHQAMRGQP